VAEGTPAALVKEVQPTALAQTEVAVAVSLAVYLRRKAPENLKGEEADGASMGFSWVDGMVEEHM
jgi:hypothetical protein